MAQATSTRAPDIQPNRGPVTGTAVKPPRRRAPFFVEFYRSAVGKKYVMAITGIIGLLFIFGHMIGNLKMYLGPAEFNHYAEFLRYLFVPILPHTVTLRLIEVVVVIAVVLHIHAAYSLTVMNHRARVVHYQSKRDYIAANYASRTMRWSGIIVGLFILWHLFDFTWTGTGYQFVRGAVYHNVATSLDRWPVAILYIVANLALGFHIWHGTWSLFQSLGWNSPRFNLWRRWLASALTAVIVVGNVSFPVMVLAGVVSSPHVIPH